MTKLEKQGEVLTTKDGKYVLTRGEGYLPEGWDLHVNTPEGVKTIECFTYVHQFGEEKPLVQVAQELAQCVTKAWFRRKLAEIEAN